MTPQLAGESFKNGTGGGGKGASMKIGSAGTSRAPLVAWRAVSMARGRDEERTVVARVASSIRLGGGVSSGCRPLSSYRDHQPPNSFAEMRTSCETFGRPCRAVMIRPAMEDV